MPDRKKPNPSRAMVTIGKLFIEIKRKKQRALPKTFTSISVLRFNFLDNVAQSNRPPIITSQVKDTSVVAYSSDITPIFCK